MNDHGYTIVPWTPENVRGVAESTIVEWIHAASNPYFDWVVGSPETAQRVLERWVGRPTSEVARETADLAILNGAVIGVFSGFPGAEAARRRMSDAVALLSNVPAEARDHVRSHLAATRGLFLPVDPADYYLSRLGVDVAARGRGHGWRLFDLLLDKGRGLGFSRFRLDVSSSNESGLRIYRGAGFRPIGEASSTDGGVRYTAMVRDESTS